MLATRQPQRRRQHRKRHRGAEQREGEAIRGFPPQRRRIEIRDPVVMGIDQQQDRAKEQRRKREPESASVLPLRLPREDARPKADDADADTGQEIGGIEQDAAGLDRKRIMARLEPGSVAERSAASAHRTRPRRQERPQTPSPAGSRREKIRQAERSQDLRRQRPDRGGDDVEREQHPQEPCLSRRPWPDGERAPPDNGRN